MKAAVAIFTLLLLLQMGFWQKTLTILPEMIVVPSVPGEDTVKAMSFGDEQAFFRFLALQIQNSGDTFGRFTSLAKYDYNRLYHWFRLLDKLDNRSNHIPSLAAYYYSQTQDTQNLRYMVNYLAEHAKGREKEKWWWLTQAIYLANHRLGDRAVALELAKSLTAVQGIPVWARQTAAFLYEQEGEMDAAYRIMMAIADNAEDLSPGELNFMRYFVEERLGKVEAMLENKKLHLLEEKE